MFKIGEFSKLTQVSIRMLRYYDELGILKPAKIDDYTGYRLYSVEQILTLQKIILLRDSKFSVSEISTIIKNWDDDFVIQELERKKNEIYIEIEKEKQRINDIDKAIDAIGDNRAETHYNVTFKEIPSYKILSLREILPNYYAEGILWEKLYKFIKNEHIEVSHQASNNIAIYHDNEYKDCNVDVEVGVVVKKFGKNKAGFTYRKTEAVDKMACSMVYGPYCNIAHAYQSFGYWLEKNDQYNILGLSRQICHKGPHNEENPEKYLTEIQIPVVKIL